VWAEAYGTVENLGRVLPMQHHARSKYLQFVILTDVKTLKYPVVINSDRYPGIVEEITINTLESFHQHGKGVIFCPLCLVSEEPFEFPTYTRSNFFVHFQENHVQFSFVMGVGFPTAYNCRFAQAYALFNAICTARQRAGADQPLEDNPEGDAINLSYIRRYNLQIEFSERLIKFTKLVNYSYQFRGVAPESSHEHDRDPLQEGESHRRVAEKSPKGPDELQPSCSKAAAVQNSPVTAFITEYIAGEEPELPTMTVVSGDSGSRRSLRRRASRGSALSQQTQERDVNFDDEFVSNRFDPLDSSLVEPLPADLSEQLENMTKGL
jgi:hypothetical protein